IPVTPQYLLEYKRGWNLWGLKAYQDHTATKMRPIVQMSSDWQEFRTEAGIPCGSVSGLTATMQKRIIRWLYCVPACVGCIKDPAAKYYVALRLSLPREVGMIIAANPSSLVSLARAGDQHKEHLIRDLDDGTPSGVLDVTTHYFEFLPESEAGKPNPITLTAEEVQEGKTYYILPTTSYGLYRYHISDLVRVTGFHNRTPLIEFLSKGAHF